jgi:hypothetical protein
MSTICWQHQIRSGWIPAQPQKKKIYPVCVAGTCASPPLLLPLATQAILELPSSRSIISASVPIVACLRLVIDLLKTCLRKNRVQSISWFLRADRPARRDSMGLAAPFAVATGPVPFGCRLRFRLALDLGGDLFAHFGPACFTC